MPLQKQDVLADPLVRETIAALKERDLILYHEQPERIVERDPSIAVLAETGGLDSVTAATAIAGEAYHSHWRMNGLHDRESVARYLPKPVGDALRLMSDRKAADFAKSGNVPATKLAMANIVYNHTGEKFDDMVNSYSTDNLREHARSMLYLAVDIMRNLTKAKPWNEVPEALVDRFLEGMHNMRKFIWAPGDRRYLAGEIRLLKAALESPADVPPPPASPLPGNPAP